MAFHGGSVKSLAVGAAALATQAAACVIHTGEADRDIGDDTAVATIAARWSLRNLADGAVTGCPAGFDIARLVAQPIDASGAASGAPVENLFDCGAQIGETTGLAPDRYRVWIEIRSRDLAALYGQSLPQLLDVRAAHQPFATELLNDGGYFQLSWSLVGAVSGRPLDCSQLVGLDGIAVASAPEGDTHRVHVDQRLCDEHASVSAGLLAGGYAVTIEARAGEQWLGGALIFELISSQNRVTDLGNFTLAIDGL